MATKEASWIRRIAAIDILAPSAAAAVDPNYRGAKVCQARIHGVAVMPVVLPPLCMCSPCRGRATLLRTAGGPLHNVHPAAKRTRSPGD